MIKTHPEFQAAKNLGGYLVTITSTAEWNWVRTNLINSGTGYNMNHNIWIGNNKVRNAAFPNNTVSPGIPIEFYWVTGENSKFNWTNTATVQHNFQTNSNIPDEPNNHNNNEGCSHIWSANSAFGSNRTWNDAPCHITSFFPGDLTNQNSAMNEFIFEFHQ